MKKKWGDDWKAKNAIFGYVSLYIRIFSKSILLFVIRWGAGLDRNARI